MFAILNLRNMFISQNLVDIFIERAPEIETIIMRDILAGWRPHLIWPGNITWATRLSALSDAQPMRLSKFDIRPLMAGVGYSRGKRWRLRGGDCKVEGKCQIIPGENYFPVRNASRGVRLSL